MNAAVPLADLAPGALAGFYASLPAATYHAEEAMSTGGIKKIIKTPQHFRMMRDQPNVPTAAMQFGTVVHAGVLEPDTLASVYAVGPDVDKRTKAGKEEWAAFDVEHAGKIRLSRNDELRALACIAAVRRHPMAARLLTGANVEESMFWTDAKYQVPCKVRWDIRNRGGLVDLKTCQDASPEEFARSCATFGYHIQEAHYRAGAEAVLNESPRFFAFIAVETEPPHLVACYCLPPEAVRVGAGWADLALERYAQARATGEWPGYPVTIEQLPFPRWALKVNQ